MENREESVSDEKTVSFLEQQAILDVVDSIVSVVSGTLTEGVNYGASLYYDPEKGFRHSVDCECFPCMLGGRHSLSEEEMNVPEDRQCHTCGMYESHSIRMLESEFIETNDWPVRHLCVGCYDVENICGTCGQPNTWGNCCECSLNMAGWYIDRDGDPTYRGEYENEELPENNSEKVKKVKDSVKEMGEFVYDLQEKLNEGEYLQLMNHLQKITNDANNL
jgi:hypothetical protein